MDTNEQNLLFGEHQYQKEKNKKNYEMKKNKRKTTIKTKHLNKQKKFKQSFEHYEDDFGDY